MKIESVTIEREDGSVESCDFSEDFEDGKLTIVFTPPLLPGLKNDESLVIRYKGR